MATGLNFSGGSAGYGAPPAPSYGAPAPAPAPAPSYNAPAPAPSYNSFAKSRKVNQSLRWGLPYLLSNVIHILLHPSISLKILNYVFVKNLEFPWVETFTKIKLILILMQEEESSVYPQLVELQQQLQQQLGKRVELSRCHLFWSFFLFWGYFGRFC